MSYSPPVDTLDVSWVGATAYVPPSLRLTASWDATAQYLAPAGFTLGVGDPTVKALQFFITPTGFTSEVVASTAWVLYPDHYRPAQFVLNASWVGAASYTPAVDTLDAQWQPVVNGYIACVGFASSAFGTQEIYNDTNYILPTGLAAGSVGTSTIYNTSATIAPGGIAPPPSSGPDAARQIPSPWVDYLDRVLLPNGISAPTFVATHSITHFIQFTDLAGRGISAFASGTPTINYAVRYVEPPFIASNIFGTPNIAITRFLLPSGWESSDVPVGAAVDINLQRLLHNSGSVDPAGYGTPDVRNAFEAIRPTGWASAEINFHIVYNQDTYLIVQPYERPAQFPNYAPYIENVNRTLVASGWQSSRFSVIGTLITNNAVPLYPAGMDATLWGPDTFIAYRDRTVSPQPWEEFYSSAYTVVYNDARVLAASGWVSSALGTPSQVLNLNRGVTHNFPYAGEVFGTAFIADAIRYVYPTVFNDVPSGIPEVRHDPYPIAPAGIDSSRFGTADFFESFTIAYPSSVNVFSVSRVGEPIVENENKTLLVFPSEQLLFGLARVFNSDTHITLTAGETLLWGATDISYRTKTMAVAPISVPVFTVLHQVRNVIPDPPAAQRVDVSGLNTFVVPGPTVRTNTISPTGLFDGALGTAALSRNTLAPVPGIFNPDQLGTPSVLATQYAYPRTVPWPITEGAGSSDLNWGKPRLTPHTIYAPSADMATQQARDNHPESGFTHAIDAFEGKGVGTLTISNYYRTVSIDNPNTSSRFGEPSLELRLRRIYIEPIRSLRMGLPVFLNVPQYMTLDEFADGIPPDDAFGTATVAPPFVPVDPFANPTGFSATLWGTARVELFNREVLPTGIPHRGNPEQDLTNPWGTPLVGFPREYVWGGYSFTLWGTAMVSHKIRYFEIMGWSSLSLDDEDLGSFSQRMRVRRRNPPSAVAAITDSAVGVHTVSYV